MAFRRTPKREQKVPTVLSQREVKLLLRGVHPTNPRSSLLRQPRTPNPAKPPPHR